MASRGTEVASRATVKARGIVWYMAEGQSV